MNGKNSVIKVFSFFFAVGYLIVNWNDISWIFNYKEIAGLKQGFLYPYADKYNAADYLAEFNNSVSLVQAAIPKREPSEKNLILEIPAINIEVPIVVANSTDERDLAKDLNMGVVIYPGSVSPEQNGQVIILGHSSPPNWPRQKYDWAFTDLAKLKSGDQIFLHINNQKYAYTFISENIVEKGEEISNDPSFQNKNILSLISCWPPGKDYQRIITKAKLEK